MKKILLSVVALSGCLSLGAQTYTDITPSKFNFHNYSAGAVTFWDATKEYSTPHDIAGNKDNAEGVIQTAQNANLGDAGYAYFYTNPISMDAHNQTSIVNVPGVGNVLQFGDFGKGWGGCYLLPNCTQQSGWMRTTLIFRMVDGTNADNNTSTLSLGVRTNTSDGTDLTAISYSDLTTTTADGKWYKMVYETSPTYSLRINFGTIMQGNNLQFALVKFETIDSEPASPVKEVTTGTAAELGIEQVATVEGNAVTAGEGALINDAVTTLISNASANVFDFTGVKAAWELNAVANPNAYVLVAPGSAITSNANVVVKDGENYSAAKINISDAYSFNYAYNISCSDVTYTRTHSATYASSVLPFAIQAGADGTSDFFVFDALNANLTLNYRTPTASEVIPAFTPILVMSGSDITLKGANVVAPTTAEPYHMAATSAANLKSAFVTSRAEGVSVDASGLEDYNVYGFSNQDINGTPVGAYVRAAQQFTINPFRTFFLLEKPAAASAAARSAASAPSTLNITIDGVLLGETTAIDNILITDGDDAELPTYNLMGQPVGNGYKGIAIRGGKKIIIK